MKVFRFLLFLPFPFDRNDIRENAGKFLK